MNKKTTLVLIGILLLICGVFLLNTNKTENTEQTVTIANLPIVDGLPLYLAIEKGYFKDAHINVNYRRFDAPNQIIDAVMIGKVDMTSTSGAMGIAAIADSKNPGKIKIYAAGGGNKVHPTNGLYVANNSGIKDVEGLKGKKLGVLPGIQWRTIATKILSQHGLLASADVELVELAAGLQVSALANGQIDGLLALEPNPTIIKAKSIGKEISPTPTIDIADPFYGTAGIINVDFLNKNPELSKKVLSILDRANKEIRENPDQSRQYLKKYTALTEDSLIEKVTLPQIKMWNEITPADIQAIQSFYEIFYKHKVVAEKLDFTKLLYK